MRMAYLRRELHEGSGPALAVQMRSHGDAEDCSKFHSSMAQNGTSFAGEQMGSLCAVESEC